MRGVADGSHQPGATDLVVIDREVVEERTEQAVAEPAPKDDLVCVGHWHEGTVTPRRVKRLHLVADSPG